MPEMTTENNEAIVNVSPTSANANVPKKSIFMVNSANFMWLLLIYFGTLCKCIAFICVHDFLQLI